MKPSSPVATGPRSTGLLGVWLFLGDPGDPVPDGGYNPDLGTADPIPRSHGGTISAAPAPDVTWTDSRLEGPTTLPIGSGAALTYRTRLEGQASWSGSAIIAFGNEGINLEHFDSDLIATVHSFTGGEIRLTCAGVLPADGDTIDLVIVYDATAATTTMAVYVDGVEVASGSGATQAAGTWGFNTIAEPVAPGVHLALVAFWSRALSATEVAAEAADPYATFGGASGSTSDDLDATGALSATVARSTAVAESIAPSSADVSGAASLTVCSSSAVAETVAGAGVVDASGALSASLCSSSAVAESVAPDLLDVAGGLAATAASSTATAETVAGAGVAEAAGGLSSTEANSTAEAESVAPDAADASGALSSTAAGSTAVAETVAGAGLLEVSGGLSATQASSTAAAEAIAPDVVEAEGGLSTTLATSTATAGTVGGAAFADAAGALSASVASAWARAELVTLLSTQGGRSATEARSTAVAEAVAPDLAEAAGALSASVSRSSAEGEILVYVPGTMQAWPQAARVSVSGLSGRLSVSGLSGALKVGGRWTTRLKGR